jgi:tetratricopeptide (TPR) repeat protein
VLGLHQPLESERLFRRAIRISTADGTERGVSPMLLNNLARTLRDLRRLPEAATYAERAFAKARQAGDEIVVNQSLVMRESIYRQLGDLERAENLLGEIEPRWRRMLPPGNGAFASLRSERALLEQARGDLPAAKADADQAVAMAEASTQPAEYLPLMLVRRSELELQMHLWEPAGADAAGALGLWQPTVEPGTFSSAVGRCQLALGRALQGQGKLNEARADFVSALTNLQPTVGADHPDTRDARRLAASLAAPPQTR